MEFDQSTLKIARDFAEIKGEINPERLRHLGPNRIQYYQSVVDAIYLLGLEMKNPNIWWDFQYLYLLNIHEMYTNE